MEKTYLISGQDLRVLAEKGIVTVFENGYTPLRFAGRIRATRGSTVGSELRANRIQLEGQLIEG